MRSRRPAIILGAIVALLTFVIYLPSLRNGFVIWDDEITVLGNRHLRTLDWNMIRWALTDVSFSLWQPAAWISHAVDYALWGLNPLGHHLSSMLLHGLNTLLVVVVAVEVLDAAKGAGPHPAGEGARSSFGDREMLLAAGVTGFLFGLHPLHVESVEWITGRTDLVSAPFFLLSLAAYVRFIRDLDQRNGTPRLADALRNRYYLWSFVLFLLSLSAKPAVVVMPAVLLLLDWYPLGRLHERKNVRVALADKAPFLLAGLAVTVATIAAHASFGGLMPIGQASFGARLLVAGKAVAMYLAKTVFPVHLIPYYPLPGTVSLLSVEFGVPSLVVVAISAACIVLAARRPAFLVAWLFFLLLLLPVLGLIQGRSTYMADRYSYLPHLGPFLLIGIGAAVLWSRAAVKAAGRSALIAAAGAASVALIMLTVNQIGVWKDTIHLWSAVIGQEPERAPIAYNNRGLAFLTDGQFDRAIEDCSRAIALDPGYYLAYYNRGKAYAGKKQFDRALNDYARAVELKPQYADTYIARGQAFSLLGQFDRALADYTAALSLDPELFDARAGRGMVYLETGRFDQALADFDGAIALNPDYAAAYLYRGMLFRQLGKYDLAIEEYTRAIALSPGDAEPYNNRGVAYKHLGQLDMAIADYSQAINRNPGFALAYCNRGVAYGMLGHDAEALQDFDRAIAIAPEWSRAYRDRGDLFRRQGNTPRARKEYARACSLGDTAACTAARQ